MNSEPDPRQVYADIIDLAHWQSPTRPRMSLYDRAAQFLSYKSLTGFDELVAEEFRLTDEMTEIGSSDLEEMNRKLALISEAAAAGERPRAAFTVFIPDERKAGGKYEEISDSVKQIDPVARRVILASTEGNGRQNRTIPFENIISIRTEALPRPNAE